MTTYRTNNPIGSADPRDLYDNSQVLDQFVNSDELTAEDRLGQSRKTIAGLSHTVDETIDDLSHAVDEAIANAGNVFVGDYAAGIELTAYNQVVRDTNGEFWRVSGSTELPYTTTGAGLPEGGAFVTVGDAALRQDLASPDGGDLVTVTTATGEQSLTDALEGRRPDYKSYVLARLSANGSSAAEDTNFVNALSRYMEELHVTGLLDKMDAVYVLQAPDEGTALINWAKTGDSYNLIPHGPGGFLPGIGWQGNTIDEWLDTQLNPSTDDALYSQNSAHMSVFTYKEDNTLYNGGDVGFVDSLDAYIVALTASDYFFTRSNHGVSGNTTPRLSLTGGGFSVWSRNSSEGYFSLYDQSGVFEWEEAAIPLPASRLALLRRDESHGARTISLATLGGGLSEFEAVALEKAQRDFTLAIEGAL